MRTASASSSKVTTATTGPKISSRSTRSSGFDGVSTVGGYQNPGPLGAPAPEGHRRAVGNVRRHPLALGGADQRSHLGPLVGRVGDHHAP